jgi:diguanylate cyclase
MGLPCSLCFSSALSDGQRSEVTRPRDVEHTLSLATAALDQIQALNLPADPPSFAVWYLYATGRFPALNSAINQTLETTPSISAHDLQRFEQVLSSVCCKAGFREVGDKLGGEAGQLMAMIEAAIGSCSSYQDSLAEAGKKLRSTRDNDALSRIVEALVQATSDVQRENHNLQQSLATSKREIESLRLSLDDARAESTTDPLTGVANRKGFDQALRNAIAQSGVNSAPLSLLMIDVDHFKRFNDGFGHQAGDEVLRLIALLLKRELKGQDTAARYGGDEFAVVLPRTNLKDAVTLAERILNTVQTRKLRKVSTGEWLGKISISVGVAEHQPREEAPAFIERADACLYSAKHAGRNRVSWNTNVEQRALLA